MDGVGRGATFLDYDYNVFARDVDRLLDALCSLLHLDPDDKCSALDSM
jgi:hypothetical protein